MAKPTIFSTPRLEVKPWAEWHTESFFSLSQDGGFNAHPITVYRQPSINSARQWIHDATAQYQSTQLGKWGVWEKQSGDLIGIAGLTPWDHEGESLVDMTYRLRSSAWGKGYGTEIAKGLVDHGFGQLQLKELTATITPDNGPSIKIATKLGLHFERRILLKNVVTDLFRLPRVVDLKGEQRKTLAARRRNYGLLARLLFFGMDLFYGRKQSLSKFKVLEVIARVPYQSWEHVAYVAMTHEFTKPDFARRIFEFVRECRHQQDNEQWHLLILEELIQKKGVRENFFLYRLCPQVIAFLYYHVSWMLYAIRPALSYRLNADFEDHAEHEYMQYVAQTPALEHEPFESSFARDYGDFRSQADLFRRIGLDERLHKAESERRIVQARFQ